MGTSVTTRAQYCDRFSVGAEIRECLPPHTRAICRRSALAAPHRSEILDECLKPSRILSICERSIGWVTFCALADLGLR